MNPGAKADRWRVLVTGAGSLVGWYLLPHLLTAGFEVQALGRRPLAADGWVQWLSSVPGLDTVL